jgi:tetratricopeptide (TPR) repeat protein
VIALFLALLTAPVSAATFDDVEAATSDTARLDALNAVLDDDALSDDHAEAWARMGRTLKATGQDEAALLAFGKAFEAGHAEAEDAVAAIEIADDIGDHAVVAGPIGILEAGSARKMVKALDASAGKDVRSHIAYLVAREMLRDDRLGPAIDWLGRVDGESPDFADAEGLRGVVLALQGKNEKALVPLQTAKALMTDRDRRFQEKTLLNLARAYYATRNWGQAIYHYKQIPRDSAYWPEAHFEQAWAHFMGADMPGALGFLHTHSSPFFAEMWFPEADMLRAQALFLLCKFDSAVVEIDRFEKRYEPLGEEMDAALAQLDDATAFADLVTFLEGGEPRLPALVLRAYRNEDRIAEARAAIDRYRKAAAGVSGLGDHDETVSGWLEDRAEALERREGARVLARAKSERARLTDWLTGLELSRIDILQLKADLYTRAAETGELEDVTADRIGKLRNLSKTRGDQWQVWPYQGEYWADELGWYQVDTRSSCTDKVGRAVGGGG